jgi:hypothetical protein
VKRPALLSLAANVTAMLLASTLIPADASATPSEVDQPASDLRIGTYNIKAGGSVSDFRAGVTAMTQRTDALGLQEVGDKRREQVLADLASSGWSYYREKPASHTPIMWRDDRFSYAGARTARISEGRWVGYEAPGQPPYQEAKYISIVHLVDKVTGGRVSLVNVHLLCGAVTAGRNYPDRPRRYKLYVDGLQRLAEITASEKTWGQVFVLGDFNAGYLADSKVQRWRLPYKTFQRLGMRALWATEMPADGRGTRKKALLDQVYSVLPATTARVQFDIQYSDHRPAIATSAVS